MCEYQAFAYNTLRHETTMFTPYKIMFGRKAYLPIDVRGSPETHLNQQEKKLDDLAKSIQQQFEKRKDLLVMAKEKIKDAQVKQKHYYDL